MLRGAAAVAALGLAGCGASGTPGDGGDTPTPTPTPSIELVDAEFEVTGRDNADDVGAEISFDDGANQVAVTGTIQGSNGCKTAALESVDYSRADDEVHVRVRTKNRKGTDDTTACTEALVYIGYEATIQFEGGTPRRARVSHDGEGVASGAHDEAAAGDGS